MAHTADPSPTGVPGPAKPERRGVLLWLSIALGVLATAALGVPIIAYLAGPLRGRKDEDALIDLGPVTEAEFPKHQTRLKTVLNPLRKDWDGMTGNLAVYVRRLDGDQFEVFSSNCAHLGCPVSWFPASGLFMCPCHGGVYYENGDRASGPPPRGLFKIPNQVKDGRLIILAGHLPTLQDTFKDRV